MNAPAAVPASPATGAPLLVIEGMTKSFGRTRALAGADFDLREREIHGIVGVSGAGKSTLARIIAGHDVYDGGGMTYRSYAVRLRDPREALRVGIALVTQDGCLVPDLSIADNIMLPQFGRPGRLDEPTLNRQALSLLASFGQADAFPLNKDVRRLTAAQRQIVEVARALGTRAKIILFDEPTAALSRSDADRLFDVMARLRRGGCAVVLASRRLDEVGAIADRVSVLREGRTVAKSRPASEVLALRDAMAGAETAPPTRPRGLPRGSDAPIAMAVESLAAPPAVRSVTLDVREGEIVGLGGLVGAGRTAILEAIFGLRPRAGGPVRLGGAWLRPHDPQAAIRAGLGFVADARRGLGIVPDLSAEENLLLGHLGARRRFGLGYRSRDKRIAAVFERMGLRRDGLRGTAMRDLTPPTQRKLAIARWLLVDLEVLILDQPTRDLDPAARADLIVILRDIAAGGVAMIVAAAAEDLLALCDRVVTIRSGQSVADVGNGRLDEETLALLATPRSAMQRHSALLRALTQDNGGASFLVLIGDDHVICLDAVVEDAAAHPGFVAGEARGLDETAIPAALRRRGTGFVAEPDGERTTLLAPIRTPRGHALGWVGLTLGASDNLPPAAAVLHRIERLAATL